MPEPQTKGQALAQALHAAGIRCWADKHGEPVPHDDIHADDARAILAALPGGWVLEETQAMVDRLAACERLGRRDGAAAERERLEPAMRKAQAGCGSLMWLANNLHQADTPKWRRMLMGAITDAQAGYAAVTDALEEDDD